MKLSNSNKYNYCKRTLLFLFISFFIFALINCDTKDKNNDIIVPENVKCGIECIYGTWFLKDISGGYDGGGVERDFKILVINEDNLYSVYQNDTILSTGQVVFLNDYNHNPIDSNEIVVEFIEDSSYCSLNILDPKYLRISQDTLTIIDFCCDGYSHFFVRCSVYGNSNYFQTNKELNFLSIEKNKIGFNKYYTSMFFINENLGFLTCYDGKILKTENGGNNWEYVKNFFEVPLHDILFLNESTGFIVGGKASCGGTGCTPPGNLLLKTNDGGETWTKVYHPNNNGEFYLIEFLNDTKGLILGLGTNLMTIDAGITWGNSNSIFYDYKYDINFINENIGYVSGIKGALFKTTDGAKNWTDISLKVDYQIYSVGFLNESVGFIGSYKNLMKTTNGGHTWITMKYAPENVTNISFRNGNELVIFGNRDYSNGNCGDVWQSNFNIQINDTWYGDERLSAIRLHDPIFKFDNNTYYAISVNDELIKIKINR